MKYSRKRATVPKCSWNAAISNELNIGLINRRRISDLVQLRIYHDLRVFESQWLHATLHCHRWSVGGYMRAHSQWTRDADPMVALVYDAGQTPFPATMRRWPNAGSLLAHRLRRWPNTKPMLGKRLMFAGLWLPYYNIGLVSAYTACYIIVRFTLTRVIPTRYDWAA